ncbi:MAG: hypothetical protein MUQ00_05255 [Candidatus Aminicenantes bacterium]|jgi:hypothetical protein|nr:hypothetical protein [Candidatus Aminicenantes bacterium]
MPRKEFSESRVEKGVPMPTGVTAKATYLGKMKFSGSARDNPAVPVSSTIRIE